MVLERSGVSGRAAQLLAILIFTTRGKASHAVNLSLPGPGRFLCQGLGDQGW
jgi:hypothetical protein